MLSTNAAVLIRTIIPLIMETPDQTQAQIASQPGPDQVHPPDPSRFVTFDEAEDGSGFYLPDGNEHFFAFDRYGGWFDEYDNYYDADGQPCEPPEDVDLR